MLTLRMTRILASVVIFPCLSGSGYSTNVFNFEYLKHFCRTKIFFFDYRFKHAAYSVFNFLYCVINNGISSYFGFWFGELRIFARRTHVESINNCFWKTVGWPKAFYHFGFSRLFWGLGWPFTGYWTVSTFPNPGSGVALEGLFPKALVSGPRLAVLGPVTFG